MSTLLCPVHSEPSAAVAAAVVLLLLLLLSVSGT